MHVFWSIICLLRSKGVIVIAAYSWYCIHLDAIFKLLSVSPRNPLLNAFKFNSHNLDIYGLFLVESERKKSYAGPFVSLQKAYKNGHLKPKHTWKNPSSPDSKDNLLLVEARRAVSCSSIWASTWGYRCLNNGWLNGLHINCCSIAGDFIQSNIQYSADIIISMCARWVSNHMTLEWSPPCTTCWGHYPFHY